MLSKKISKTLTLFVAVMFLLVSMIPSASAITWTDADKVVVPAVSEVLGTTQMISGGITGTMTTDGSEFTVAANSQTYSANWELIDLAGESTSANGYQGAIWLWTNKPTIKVTFDIKGSSAVDIAPSVGVRGNTIFTETYRKYIPLEDAQSTNWVSQEFIIDISKGDVTTDLCATAPTLSAGRIWFYVRNSGCAGAISIRNLKVVGVKTPASPAATYTPKDNMIKNVTAENAALTGAAISATEAGHDGTVGDTIVAAPNGDNGYNNMINIYPSVGLVSGAEYTLSFWYKEAAANTATNYAAAAWLRPVVGGTLQGNNDTYTRKVAFSDYVKGTWKKYAFDITVNANEAAGGLDYFRINLPLNSGATANGGNTLYFDDFKLLKKPVSGAKPAITEVVYYEDSGKAQIIFDECVETAQPATVFVEGYDDEFDLTYLTGNTYEVDLAEYDGADSILEVSIKDIWGGTQTYYPVEITRTVASSVTKSLALTSASAGSNIFDTGAVACIGGASLSSGTYTLPASAQINSTQLWENAAAIGWKDVAASKPVLMISFSIKGATGATGGTQTFLRSNSGLDTTYVYSIPQADLADGNWHEHTWMLDLTNADLTSPLFTADAVWLSFRNNTGAEGFEASGITYQVKDINVKRVAKDASYTATSPLQGAIATVVNSSASQATVSGTIILAEYTNDGKLVDISIETISDTVGVDSTKTIASKYLTGVTSGNTVRAFWWDSLNGMVPITAVAE